MPEQANGANLSLERGKVYFDRFTTAGVKTGELFLGNCEALTISVSEDEVRKYSSAEAAAPLLASAPIRRTFELSMTLDEWTPENLALAFMGNVSALAQGSGSISNEIITVAAKGRYYPTSKRKISTVVVTGPSNTPTYVANTDYKVDGTEGRIYIMETGAIPATGNLEVDYAYAADTSVTIQGGNASKIEGSLRFVGDPVSGPTQTVEIWKVRLKPEGEMPFIGDDYATFTIKGEVFADLVNHPTESLFRIIKVA